MSEQYSQTPLQNPQPSWPVYTFTLDAIPVGETTSPTLYDLACIHPLENRYITSPNNGSPKEANEEVIKADRPSKTARKLAVWKDWARDTVYALKLASKSETFQPVR